MAIRKEVREGQDILDRFMRTQIPGYKSSLEIPKKQVAKKDDSGPLFEGHETPEQKAGVTALWKEHGLDTPERLPGRVYRSGEPEGLSHAREVRPPTIMGENRQRIEKAIKRREGADNRYKDAIRKETNRIVNMLLDKDAWKDDPVKRAAREEFMKRFKSAHAGKKKWEELRALNENVWSSIEKLARAKTAKGRLAYPEISDKNFAKKVSELKKDPAGLQTIAKAIGDGLEKSAAAKAAAPSEVAAPGQDKNVRVRRKRLLDRLTPGIANLIADVEVERKRYDREVQKTAMEMANAASQIMARERGPRGRLAASRYRFEVPEGDVESWRDYFKDAHGRRRQADGKRRRIGTGRPTKGFSERRWQSARRYLEKSVKNLGYHSGATGKSDRTAKATNFLRRSEASPAQIVILANGLRPNATEEQYNQATGLLAQMQWVFDEKTKQSRGAQTQLYGIEAKQDAARDAYERAKTEREAIEAAKAKTRDEEHRKQLQLKQLDFEIKNYHTQMEYLNKLGTRKYEKIERDDDGNITGKASGYKPAADKTTEKPVTPDFTPRGFTPRRRIDGLKQRPRTLDEYKAVVKKLKERGPFTQAEIDAIQAGFDYYGAE